eukprot:6130894-Amphidinium_carterae.1
MSMTVITVMDSSRKVGLWLSCPIAAALYLVPNLSTWSAVPDIKPASRACKYAPSSNAPDADSQWYDRSAQRVHESGCAKQTTACD